ncbi:hypothetical protein KIH27_06580 [Mycobacterium sp. M1]|uniref:Low molecular weight antigen MTB12-like C-terminal domain-containing protein n=1 Tax=Mycolicibacter acidiphilus TaxID=2835306 RepID=A0ABS5RIH6_9MYCO|nr:hypothetical protein [Mycolicibacter acidiphilus]MBS9533256.1 hypothetical protein [Mycolicibacter acidiphilus]
MIRTATLRRIATQVMMAALVVAAAPVTATVPAQADCGDPGQPACTGPVPTVDRVVAIMAELTDPNIPAANKTDIVTPGFTPEEAQTVDDHLNRMAAHYLPLNFVVTDIQPAPDNLAGATLAATGPIPLYLHTYPRPIVLADQGEHWLITHDSAISMLDVFYRAASYRPVPVVIP